MLKRLRRFATYKYRRVLIYLRRITLPGFQGVPVYDVLRFFIVGLFDSKFTLLAAAMSYNFFFSAVPALFLLYTLLTYFPAEHLDMQAETRSYIENFVPHNVYTLIDKIATSDYASERRSGTIILGILLTVYGALRGIIAMMKAFTKDAETKEIFKRRNIFQLYSTAFILFIILASLFFVTIAVLVVGKSMINYMQEVQLIGRGIESFLLTGFTYFITLILIFLSVSLIYYLAPATQQRWKFLTPGGIVAGVLTFLTLIGYGYFISHIANFGAIYGSLGAIVLLMLLFYYISMVLLIGFELNAAIDLASYHQKERQLSHTSGLARTQQDIIEEWWDQE